MKRIRVAALIIKGKRILLVKDVGSDKFSTPGGGVEKEKKDVALLREIKEELGVEVQHHKFYFSFEFFSSKHGMIQEEHNYFVSCSDNVVGSAEVGEIRWFSKDELLENSSLFLDMHVKNLFPRIIKEGLL